MQIVGRVQHGRAFVLAGCSGQLEISLTNGESYKILYSIEPRGNRGRCWKIMSLPHLNASNF